MRWHPWNGSRRDGFPITRSSAGTSRRSSAGSGCTIRGIGRSSKRRWRISAASRVSSGWISWWRFCGLPYKEENEMSEVRPYIPPTLDEYLAQKKEDQWESERVLNVIRDTATWAKEHSAAEIENEILLIHQDIARWQQCIAFANERLIVLRIFQPQE